MRLLRYSRPRALPLYLRPQCPTRRPEHSLSRDVELMHLRMHSDQWSNQPALGLQTSPAAELASGTWLVLSRCKLISDHKDLTAYSLDSTCKQIFYHDPLIQRRHVSSHDGSWQCAISLVLLSLPISERVRQSQP